jgi:hypothetical protein
VVTPDRPPRPASRELRVDANASPDALDALIRDLQANRIDAKTLDVRARRAVVAFLAERRSTTKDGKPGKVVTHEALARLLKVSTKRISSDLTAVRKAIGARLMQTWGAEGAVGFLERLAMEAIRDARELGDPAMAWMIGSSFVKQLKELGAFGGRGDQEGFKVTFETVGPNLAALTRKLEDAFRPELTGERIVEGRALPLPSKLEGVEPPDGGDTDPNSGLATIEASGDPDETIEAE